MRLRVLLLFRRMRPWLLLAAAVLVAFAAGRTIRTMTCAFGPAAAVAQEGDGTHEFGTGPDAPPNIGDRHPHQAPSGARAGTPAATPVVETAVSQPSRQWQPPEQYDDKYVPIISLLQGTRLGVARVNGPRSRIILTQAVVQFSIGFGDFADIDIYVPVSTREPQGTLPRVQDVGVTAMGELRL